MVYRGLDNTLGIDSPIGGRDAACRVCLTGGGMKLIRSWEMIMHYELHYPLIQIVAFDFVVEGLAGDAELGSGGGEVAAIVSNGLSDHAAFHIFEGRFVRSGWRICLSGER